MERFLGFGTLPFMRNNGISMISILFVSAAIIGNMGWVGNGFAEAQSDGN